LLLRFWYIVLNVLYSFKSIVISLHISIAVQPQIKWQQQLQRKWPKTCTLRKCLN